MVIHPRARLNASLEIRVVGDRTALDILLRSSAGQAVRRRLTPPMAMILAGTIRGRQDSCLFNSIEPRNRWIGYVGATHTFAFYDSQRKPLVEVPISFNDASSMVEVIESSFAFASYGGYQVEKRLPT